MPPSSFILQSEHFHYRSFSVNSELWYPQTRKILDICSNSPITRIVSLTILIYILILPQKQIIHEIEKEVDFKILEMQTNQDHIYLLVNSESKAALSDNSRTEQETTNRVWKTQNEYLKNTVGKNIHYCVMYIQYLLSVMLATKQPKITYGTRVEVGVSIL